MMLPETMVGMIDLTTLAAIHHYLSQSALEDDLALAAWVKQSFLYEPITSLGREIRTTEGFAQLDRAYRRVRSLTNKAQDKWPFFSKAWKELSATTVRKNARGESSTGAKLPGMSDGPSAPTDTTGPEAQSHVVSGPTVELGTDTIKMQSAEATAASDVPCSAALPTKPALSFEGGKVRGSNGRFLPRENSGRSKGVSKAKSGRKAKSTKPAALYLAELAPVLPAQAAPVDKAMEEALPTPISADRSEEDEQATQNLPGGDINTTAVSAITEPEKPLQTSECSTDPAPTLILAAHSPAVFTNLDRLPPGSWLAKKRKLEAAQESQKRKRARPSPLPESKKQRKDSNSTAVAEAGTLGVATRRTTRRTAAKMAETAPEKRAAKQQSPVKQAARQPSPEKQEAKQPSPEKEEEPVESIESKTMIDAEDALPLGSPKATSEEASRSAPKTASALANAAKIELLARVQTPVGVVDVPVSRDNLQRDLEMVEKYAGWMEKEGTEISFPAFKSILGLGMKK